MNPIDYENPDWEKGIPIHNWRKYISGEVRAIWHTLTTEQKRAVAENAERLADNEEWY